MAATLPGAGSLRRRCSGAAPVARPRHGLGGRLGRLSDEPASLPRVHFARAAPAGPLRGRARTGRSVPALLLLVAPRRLLAVRRRLDDRRSCLLATPGARSGVLCV